MTQRTSTLARGILPGSHAVRWLVPAAFAAFVVGTIALGVALHLQAKRSAEKAAFEALHATAKLSAHSLNTWLAERNSDAEVIATSPLLAEALARWHAREAGFAGAALVLQSHLDQLRRRYAYRTAAIVDPRRQQAVFLSGSALDAGQVRQIAQADALDRAKWIELQTEDQAVLRAGLVRSTSERPGDRFLLYLEIEPNWLVGSLGLATPMNWAGETILVQQTPRGLRFLSGASGSALQELPANTAGRGQPKAPTVEAQLTDPNVSDIQGRNRHGVRSFALREDVNLPSWILVSALSADAVYAGVDERTWVFTGGLGALLMLGTLAYAAWRRGERMRIAVRETGLRRHYEHMLRGSADIFVLTDEQGSILDVSEASVSAYGYTRERMLGMDVRRLRPPESVAAFQQMQDAMKPGDSKPFRVPRVRADGSRFLMEGTIGCFESDGNRYYVGIGRDITHQAEVETQRRVAASFFERSSAGIIISTRDKQIVSASPSVTAITGYRADELIGNNTEIFNPGLDLEVLRRARDTIQRTDFWEGELRVRRKDGSIFPARWLVTAYRGADGEIEQRVEIFTDLTRLKQAERQAEYLAFNDPLTQLPNRAMLDRELPAFIAEISESGAKMPASLTLALINLDGFKGVNESFGRSQGDAMLIAVADRLRALSADFKGLYRYSGDEFMIVLLGGPVSHALAVSQVRSTLAAPLVIAEHRVSPTASIGVASFPEHASTAEELVHNVESAMRIAKAQGKNTWRLYAREMNATAYDDMLLAVDLRQAIDARELQLHLQPQFTLAEGSPVGVEALLRWNHKTRGPVSPGRFIPIAESSGMILEISTYVLREAARIWASWRRDGLVPLPIAVNLSAIQFQSPDFIAEVARTLAEYELPPGALEMELTEGLIMADTDAAIQRMFQLVQMGIQLAIDDFGTGYSSLSYLRRFPVAKLKIDRSFVLDLGKNGSREGEAIATAVIAMAKSLKLKVIAEGVETAEQRDFLQEQGCDEVQGYLYARPVPVDAITEMLPRCNSLLPCTTATPAEKEKRPATRAAVSETGTAVTRPAPAQGGKAGSSEPPNAQSGNGA